MPSTQCDEHGPRSKIYFTLKLEKSINYRMDQCCHQKNILLFTLFGKKRRRGRRGGGGGEDDEDDKEE